MGVADLKLIKKSATVTWFHSLVGYCNSNIPGIHNVTSGPICTDSTGCCEVPHLTTAPDIVTLAVVTAVLENTGVSVSDAPVVML